MKQKIHLVYEKSNKFNDSLKVKLEKFPFDCEKLTFGEGINSNE